MKALILAAALALAGCAAITPLPSPEAQIKAGADTVRTTATLGTVALREHKISVNTAESYSTMLHAADEALKKANLDLITCRKDTGSTAATSPDPCWPKVADVIAIALRSIADVKQAVSK